MEVRILGSSGSVSGAHNPTSGYLLRPENEVPILIDCGPGVLSQLQQHADPANTHMLFSHLHPDHCLDFPSLLVWRRFHPISPSSDIHQCFGPDATPTHLGRLSSDEPDDIESFADTFHFHPWRVGKTETLSGCTITPYPAVHPIQAYALRVENQATGKVVAYSGDSAHTEELIPCAMGADLFLCEATWGASSKDKAPGMHMSGAEAGRLATQAGVKHLVLIHIPPWGDPQAAFDAARAEFDGPISLGLAGDTWDL
ncbi:MBL fold metallo-hydrolase [Corynebacterium poyangense]|uniref:MBL fold metallo-hydrolase n=1 Tax=Corynebacterium poyangense TaxID=2684405 RepID=A0A7H0SQS2_9CORY|nr:MBL fold metallo-hydrolase [Corynebacterium poyangense]MBZ8178226.1 MBL fold metallo-hydrolase [Corynebacterium poyangense]QNQ90897.1 MBL fold metallo-hydrolase [Corynebacterium poyangense]